MARETSYTQYKKIITDIKAGKIAPVYLLHGDEDFFIDSIADYLQNNIVAEADRDFNLSVIYGADATYENVMNAVRQFPMMAERRLVMLKEAQSMDDFKRKLEKMTPYLEQPAERTIFVITYKGDPINATSKAAKAIAKGNGVFFTSTELFESQVAPVIKEYCNSHRVTIEDSAISLLIEYAGTNITNITAAIDKILTAEKATLNRITTDEISIHIGVSKEYSPHELVRAVAKRDYTSSIRIAEFFIRNPKASATPINSRVLFLFFSNMLLCHYSKDKSPRGIAATVGAKNEYANKVKDIETGMKHYSAGACVRIIRAIREFDAMSKGVGSLRKDTDMQLELVYKIFTL